MGRAEAGISRYVLDRLMILERQGQCYYFRANSFSGRIVNRRSGELGSYINNSKPGLPDVIACIKGAFIGIELKSITGRQSPSQKTAQQQIEALGGKYWLIRTPEQFEQALKTIL